MTVKELIAQLETLPSKMRVVVDLHSEWTELTTIDIVEGYDNGGYVSSPSYSGRGVGRAQSFVHLS